MKDLHSVKEKALSDTNTNHEYQKLESEFMLINALISMRKSAELTQHQVAMYMGTKEANISRLERGSGNPTLKTLLNYAKACGCRLHIGFDVIT